MNLKSINEINNISLFRVNYLEIIEDEHFFLILAKILMMHNTVLFYSRIESRFVKDFAIKRL